MSNLAAKFKVSSFNRSRNMEEVEKIPKVGHDPFLRNFALYRLGRPVANLRAKFVVSSFNRSPDMEGRQNSLTD